MATAPDLAWTKGRFGPSGCSTGTYAACEWSLSPVFGGLAQASPDESNLGFRWDWTEDGRRWKRLRGLPAHTDRLWSDGTAAGAFAYTEEYAKGDVLITGLWRTADAKRWRRILDTSVLGDWPSFASSNGHYVTASSHMSGEDDPLRLYASADGWTWEEVPVPWVPSDAEVRLDGSEAGFIVQWWPWDDDSVNQLAPSEDETSSSDESPSMFALSRDGVSWSVPMAYPVEVAVVYRVPWGLVGLEIDGDNTSLDNPDGGLVAAWTSSDGVRWDRHVTVGQPSRATDDMESEARIYQVPGGLLLHMYLQDDLYFSRDGVAWMPLRPPTKRGCDLTANNGDGTAEAGTLVCLGDGERYWTAELPAP